MAWVLTSEALEDLEALAIEGEFRFGPAQAARYERQLVDIFDALAAHPEMAPLHETDGLQLRLMPSGRHHILYIVENQDVVILRILHALQNWPDLIERPLQRPDYPLYSPRCPVRVDSISPGP